MITCDEIIEETKTILTKHIEHNEKHITCKIQNLYILLAFSSIINALLIATIAVSIYCYLIKYRAKQKHLLPFHNTNKELKEIMY